MINIETLAAELLNEEHLYTFGACGPTSTIIVAEDLPGIRITAEDIEQKSVWNGSCFITSSVRIEEITIEVTADLAMDFDEDCYRDEEEIDELAADWVEQLTGLDVKVCSAWVQRGFYSIVANATLAHPVSVSLTDKEVEALQLAAADC